MAYQRKNDLSQAALMERLHYDPETGVFTWRCAAGGKKAGSVAGTPTDDGYITIGFRSRIYMAHRLVWLYVHGEWPSEFIDHINGNRTDNRIANLREADQVANLQNKRAPLRGNPYLGVCFNKKAGKWQASIQVNGKANYLGVHDTPEQAHAAYVAAKRRLHPANTL